MGHRQYSGNHPRFSKRADERYDAKEAYNKDLTASARLHYLENVRHDHDSPANMHTDAHMRRQAKRIAKKTKGDAQDIYYEMKSKKMSEKKDSPAKNIKSFAKKVRTGVLKPVFDVAEKYEDWGIKQADKISTAIQGNIGLESIKKPSKATDVKKNTSPMKMEGKGCAKSEGGSECVVKRGGEYVILNNKKGGVWRSGFASRSAADKVLAAYHANK